jgi:hypothetical protein
MIIQRLLPHLPAEYTAEPRVHLCTNYEIDDYAFETEHSSTARSVEGGPDQRGREGRLVACGIHPGCCGSRNEPD